ncbi:hypothetical protein SK128_014154 [Halocaridina rubra]|uniref:Uncharacterized protein n=1 Tax=Halocaridina rubra TaxID=373956 RepID=A0AAN8XE98_HALRR
MDDKEDEDAEKGEVVVKRSSKRKLSLEEYENILNKRHAALTPFRNETINRWYEKTKLLSKSRGLNKFGGFEVSALQQLENVLNNKMQLIQRTQLTGVTRGTSYHKLGQCDTNANGEEAESFDPEIFDDGDFYSRALEEMVKSKISFSDDMMDVSKKWIEIQKLRKKAKRKVDTRASKGRKLKYEIRESVT